MSAALLASGRTVVVRVDFAVSEDLAGWIAAYMAATGEPLTMENLRAHARHAYASEGDQVDVDVEQWAKQRWSFTDEPDWEAFARANRWLRSIAAGSR